MSAGGCSSTTASAFPALTPGAFARARCFVLAKWRELAVELGLGVPPDLSRSCRYVSLFVQSLYGGEIAGNYQHQFNVIAGEIVDLNADAADVLAMRQPYQREPELFLTTEHVLSMQSCGPRVARWVREFRTLESV